jgi:CBS-domain-containing membrane protein
MDIVGKAKRVRIYMGESDRYHGHTMYTAIVQMLRKDGYAGATVLRGIEGFGHSSTLRTTRIEVLSMDLPIVIDVVDRPEKIDALLPRLEEMGVNGLVTVEEVEVHAYGSHRVGEVPADLRVRDLMTRDVSTIGPDAPVSDAVKLLYGRLFRALPVVDGEQRVLGVLTNSDLVERAGLPFRIQVLERLGRGLESLGADIAERRVSEVMSTPAVTIGENATAREAAALMSRRGIKRLPVVDHSGRLVGILSRLDLLSSAAHLRAAEESETPDRAGAATVVDELMLREVPTVRDLAPLSDVLNDLLASPIHRVVVVDAEGRVAGIISDADVLDCVSPHARPGVLEALRARLPGGEAAAEHLRRANARAAEDVMNRDVVCARSGMSLVKAAELMVSRRRKLLPVVDDSGRLMGVIRRDDVLGALAEGQA